jgi:purine-binding chemotaxis protein CheW
VGDVLCALPLQHVEETMRPLPVERVAGVPCFVLGLALIRGAPTPVIDAGALLNGGAALPPTRFVTVKTGSRLVALAVDAVLGIREISAGSVDALPPLFQNANLDVISAVGTLDSELLLVLRGARLVPEELWATIEAGCQTA